MLQGSVSTVVEHVVSTIIPVYNRPQLLRAAVEITPIWRREQLELGPADGLSAGQARFVRALGRLVERTAIPGSAPILACRRLGLSPRLLYRRSRSSGA